MNPRDLVPMEGAKTWLVITAIVVLLSGFFLFNAIQAKERERKLRIQKEQELSQKLNELLQAQTDLADLKKQKEESEQILQEQITEQKTKINEIQKAADKARQRANDLAKEKDRLAKLLEQNTSMIAKLNKKIEKLEREKEDLQRNVKSAGISEDSYPAPAGGDASGEPPAYEGSARVVDPATGSQLPEVVDLGQIVLHGEAREPARVEHVNTMYGFIVVSAGSEDGLKTDTIVNVSRDNRFVAKAVVKKARSSVATALLLPEWTKDEVRLGDVISVNSLEVNEIPKRRLADYLPGR